MSGVRQQVAGGKNIPGKLLQASKQIADTIWGNVTAACQNECLGKPVQN